MAGVILDSMANGPNLELNQKSYATVREVMGVPNLVRVQSEAFEWFKKSGLRELFDEISPIISFNKRWELSFGDYRFGEPKYEELECRERAMTYAAPLWVEVQLLDKETGEIQRQDVFMGDFPLMTEQGTFIINGAERVVVSQLIRSPGVYFTVDEDRSTGRELCMAKLIPNRGAWMEFETSRKDVLSVKVDRKRKIPLTVFMRAVLAYNFRGKDFDTHREAWQDLWGQVGSWEAMSEEERSQLLDRLVTERVWWINRARESYLRPDLSETQIAIVREDTKRLINRELEGYSHRCWRDESHTLDSEINDICPECGWYICSCGTCQNRKDDRYLIVGFEDTSFPHECSGAYNVYEGTDEELEEIFAYCDNDEEHRYIPATIERDVTKTAEEALIEFYKRLRPGDPPTPENAESFLQTLLFSSRRYDLGKVGRYKLNKRLGISMSLEYRALTRNDLIKVVARIIEVNNGVMRPDDIDHLGNRRTKTVGELIQNQLRIGLLRVERVVRERMSIRDPEQITPISLINIRPVVAATREFFGGSQLSQFMDQTNPLSELTHKRRLSALGPGGLRRERAGFDVRDVHHSHYGRICPIETPEGPNIGLIGSLATYARVNEYGFVETPYRRVINVIYNDSKAAKKLVGQTLRRAVMDDTTKEVIAEEGTLIDEALAERLVQLPKEKFEIVPYVSSDIRYLSADEEDQYTIAQANALLDKNGHFVSQRVSVRQRQSFSMTSVDNVDFMDVSPKQIVSVSAALIPFLEHDDANRALMGSNMQRQGVPLLVPEHPIVGTGMELQAAIDSGQVVTAEEDGEVISVTSEEIVVLGESGEHVYSMRKYNRSNQSTCIDQRPAVNKGDWVCAGQVVADSSSTDKGKLALGQNVLVAFMSWEGGNYEDAILLSDEIVRRDCFTSIHIEKHEVEARDTKLGPEEITRDIPNVGEDALRDLDEGGVIRIGAEVSPGDILVGKITPKGETDLTPEERLLRAIFGEKAREVKDSSLRLPHGERGKVVDVKEFSQEEHRDMPVGVDKMVQVMVAQKRKITEGDKMAGRHGNKGVVSKVLPVEDMPFLEDGTSVEIILNPLGVPARMNIGQVLETHLGWAAERLGFSAVSPVFDGAREDDIMAELARAWLIDWVWQELKQRAFAWLEETERLDPDDLWNDDEVRLLYLEYLLPEEDARLWKEEPITARRTALRMWLRERGYNPKELLSFEDDARTREEKHSADQQIIHLCLQIWLEHHLQAETLISCIKNITWHEAIAAARKWITTRDAKQWLQDRAGVTTDFSNNDVAAACLYVYYLLGGDAEDAAGLMHVNVAQREYLCKWLQDRGYNFDDLLQFSEQTQLLGIKDGAEVTLRGLCIREWLGRDEDWTELTLDELNDTEITKVSIIFSRNRGIPMPTSGKMIVYDGRTGLPFDQPVTVGIIDMMKLAHLVEDKVHARSTGPYSLVTQQPLGGKAQFGGQRFGEMEVWALEAYGAAYTLQEMLTVKSDDVSGRVKTYEAIVKGEKIVDPGVPESFRVLVRELQSLGLAVEVIDEKDERVQFGKEEEEKQLPVLGLDLGLGRRRGRGFRGSR